MEKTNFENLQVYKLSERLADQTWKIVIRWDTLAKDTCWQATDTGCGQHWSQCC